MVAFPGADARWIRRGFWYLSPARLVAGFLPGDAFWILPRRFGVGFKNGLCQRGNKLRCGGVRRRLIARQL